MPNHEAYPMTYSNRKSQPEVLESGIKIEQLLQEYYPYIRRLALSILDDPHEAEDVAQETFIAAHRSLAGFRGESIPKTWLTSIAINRSLGRLRKRKLRQVLVTALQAMHLLRNSPPTPELAVDLRVPPESQVRLFLKELSCVLNTKTK